MGFPGVVLGARMDSDHEKQLVLSCRGPRLPYPRYDAWPSESIAGMVVPGALDVSRVGLGRSALDLAGVTVVRLLFA